MEMIVGEEFRATERQYVLVDSPLSEICPKFRCTPLRFRQGARTFHTIQMARLIYCETDKRQRFVEVGPHRLESITVANVALWLHRMANEG